MYRLLFWAALNTVISVCASVEFFESDLIIGGRAGGVILYNARNADGNIEFYKGAFIYSRTRLERLPHSIDDVFYWTCLGDPCLYKDLEQHLESLKEMVNSPEFPILTPHICPPVSLLDLVNEIQESSIVGFTFGAGLSHPYIPTLIEFFQEIGLEKMPAYDWPTPESLMIFIKKLLGSEEEKEEVLTKVRKSWPKIVEKKVRSTPGHQALKELLEWLTSQKKTVYVYTDNTDGIDEAVGIRLSEKLEEEGVKSLVYPSIEETQGKKISVLVLGQSFDSNWVLGQFLSYKDIASVRFFSLNTDPHSIIVNKGIHLPGQIASHIFEPSSLNMDWLEGPLNSTLFQLLHALKEHIS